MAIMLDLKTPKPIYRIWRVQKNVHPGTENDKMLNTLVLFKQFHFVHKLWF